MFSAHRGIGRSSSSSSVPGPSPTALEAPAVLGVRPGGAGNGAAGGSVGIGEGHRGVDPPEKPQGALEASISVRTVASII